jgi:hypothetical protein
MVLCSPSNVAENSCPIALLDELVRITRALPSSLRVSLSCGRSTDSAAMAVVASIAGQRMRVAS